MNTVLRSFAILSMLGVSSLLGGCGGSDASVPAPTDDPAEEDLTKAGPLSQGMVCAALSAVNDLGNPNGLKDVAEKSLKGEALSDFKSWQKGFLPDYPSAAYELPVKYGKKTYTFWYLEEENDGGGCTGIYRTDGRLVTNECAGESGDINWSAPADKCK
ncbi:MAG TPA: hypothetical protein VIF62_23530 [Labilithrix sp.]|jgi:hypothetical protein